MKIFLIGYRCTGKTFIGKILATRLNFNFIDIDKAVEHHTGSNIAQIVEVYGWKKFRQIEQNILFKTKTENNTVVATGGGAVINPENQTFIKKNGFCVWLDADLKTILYRLNTDNKTKKTRPPLTEQNLLKETKDLITLRRPLYEKTAHLRIDTSLKTSEEIVNIIDRRFADVRQQLR